MSDRYQEITEDELNDIVSDIKSEIRRRKEEKKIPVFAADGTYHKSMMEALSTAKKEIDRAIEMEKQNPGKWLGGYGTDGVDRTIIALRVVFWPESEYNARPNRVFGAPYR